MKFKKDDLVFYTSPEKSQIPCRIVKVHNKMLTLTIGGCDRFRAYKNSCILQDDWLKLNEPELYEQMKS